MLILYQVMDLHREEIDTPFNVRVYEGGYIGLAPITIIHDITIWLSGEMDHSEYVTVRRNGSLTLHQHGHKSGEKKNIIKFTTLRIQDDGEVHVDTDPVTEDGFTFYIEDIWVEGGGNFHGTRMFINTVNLTTDDGGYVHGNSHGYRTGDTKDFTTGVNPGEGIFANAGSSGAGHGGTSGRGGGTPYTGTVFVYCQQ